MSRTLRRRFFLLILLFSAGVYWIYFMLRHDSNETSWVECISCQPSANENQKILRPDSIEASWVECISCHQSTNENTSLEEQYRSLLEEQLTEMMYNDIEEDESYPLDIRYIPARIREKLEEELPQEGDWRHIYLLKEMLEGNELSRDIEFEDDFLRLYLLSNDYQIDVAFYKVLNYLHLMQNHNYFFHNISFDFTQNPAYRCLYVLPQRRMDGSVTLVFRLGEWDPDEFPFEHLKQIFFMMYMQQARNPVTQASGFGIIYDFAGTGFRLLKYGTPQNIYLLHHIAYEVMPVRYVGIHLVNINFIGNFLVTLSRPFLPKHIEKIFYTHSSMKELLQYYPSFMLPVELGGNLTDYYTPDWIRLANKEHGNYPPGGLKNIF